MPDNTSPKLHTLVASMNIQQDANNYMQKTQQIHSTLSTDIDDLLFQRTCMLEHTQLKQHDNTVASLDV